MCDRDFLDYEEKLSVPLYKYYGNLNYAKDVIENHRIHFEAPKEYNDIFDSAKYVTDEEMIAKRCLAGILLNTIQLHISEDDMPIFIKKVVQHIDESEEVCIKDVLNKVFECFPELNRESILDTIRSIMSLHNVTPLEGMKISCFSENKDSLLMWSYYAKSHSGVCLEFDLTEDKELVKHCHKVQYTKHFDVGDLSYTYFTKSEQWHHEQEWRIVIADCDYVKTNSLKAIYMGHRMDAEELWEFMQLAKKYKLDLYFANPSKTEYKLNFCKIYDSGKPVFEKRELG